jgi:RimJ/RimL family protein N-acetyltransferase
VIVTAAVDIHPLRAADEPAWWRAVAGLSPETRRRRFGGPKPRLSDREATYLLDVGHDGREALVAIDPDTREVIGIARYAVVPDDARTADVAIVVADEWQGHGIGPALLRELAGAALDAGIPRLVATTLGENRPAHKLLARGGFRLVAGWVGELEYAAPSARVATGLVGAPA